MDVQLLKDAREFARVAQAWLSADPFSTNVVGVHLDGVLGGGRLAGDHDIWIVATAGGQVVGAAMHTPPHNPFLPRLPQGVAAQLARGLLDSGRTLLGVNGETEAVSEFAEAWAGATGGVSVLRRETRMYRLGELVAPGTAGDTRRAAGPDRDLVAEWLSAFSAEAAPDAPQEVAAVVERRIAAGELWLWCVNGDPTSLAAHSAASAGVARVGPVYTPAAHRRHGYGSAVTAQASRAALGSGADHVVLYTDLANPTSNAIYQAIGYVPDHAAQERVFRSH